MTMPPKSSCRFTLHLLLIALALVFSAPAFSDEGDAPISIEAIKTFSEAYSRIKSEYVEETDDKKLVNDAIKGMLSGLDPHSAYLDYEGLKDFGMATGGEFGGVGIDVSLEEGWVKVVTPIEDTPAYRAGIKTGDIIYEVDGVSMKGVSISDAIRRMRGTPETSVKIAVLRKSEPNPIDFVVVRQIIKNPSVKYKLSDPEYPYLRITQFQEHTGEDLAKALKSIYKDSKSPVKGLVLDLRNNPGGLVTSAVAVASAFLERDKLIIYSDGRTPDSRMRLFANPKNYVGDEAYDYMRDIPAEIKTVPMIVLVNSGSASAAEIVSGALQDHNRAKILGTQSFGKGTIQTLLPLSSGSAIKLTVAQYFTPSGKSIQAKGITPDILVNDSNDSGGGQGPVIRESDLSHHLANPNDHDRQTSERTSNRSEGISKETKKQFADASPYESGTESDYQYTQAVNALKGMATQK